MSWQLSATDRSTCILNDDDVAVASCALERLQFAVAPQRADPARIDSDTAADWGYFDTHDQACAYFYRGRPNAAVALAACRKRDRPPVAACAESPLHASACSSSGK